MKLIQCLTDNIHEELADAEKYAKLALKYKGDHPDVAKLMDKLSAEEMEHMMMLHNMTSSVIEDYRRTNGEPPASMLAVYDYLHRQQIDKAAEVKNLQAMYKEG